MTQLSIAMLGVPVSVGEAACVCVCVTRTPPGANGFKQHKHLINISIFSLGGLKTHRSIRPLARTLKHTSAYAFTVRDAHKHTL